MAVPFGRSARQLLTAAVLSCALPVSSAIAQKSGGRAVSADSAAAIRASLERPPGQPPFDGYDAVALPFRVATFPIALLGHTTAWVIGLLTKPGPPPFYMVALRDVSAWGAVPSLGSIGPRSGVAARLALVRFEPFFLETAYSIRHSQQHSAGLAFGDESARVGLAYTFSRDAQPHFWGIGPETRDADESDYLLDQQRLDLFGHLQAAPRLQLRGGVGLEDNRVGRGLDDDEPSVATTFGEAALFGLGERPRFFRFDLGFTLDLTRQRLFQRRGVWLSGGSSLFRGTDGTEADFHRFQGELRAYLPLNPRQELAVRGLLELNRPDSGPGVPFTHLAAVGSRDGNRGFSTNRFRDLDAVSVMTEWRYEIWRELQERTRVESFVFLDLSGVEHRVTEIGGSDLRFGYGTGMRVVTLEDVAFVWYLGLSEEGTRFRLSLESAW